MSCESMSKDDKTDTSIIGYNEERLNQNAFANQIESVGGFTFTAQADWNITIGDESKTETNSSWVAVTPMSGVAGNHTIHIYLDVNYSGNDRVEKIHLKSGGSHLTITIAQSGKTEQGQVPVVPKVITSINLTQMSGATPVSTFAFKFKYNNREQLVQFSSDRESEALNYQLTHHTDSIDVTLDYNGNLKESSEYLYDHRGLIVSGHTNKKDMKDQSSTVIVKHLLGYEGDKYLNRINIAESIITKNLTLEWLNGNMTRESRVTKVNNALTSHIIYDFKYTQHPLKTNLDLNRLAYDAIMGFDLIIPTIIKKTGQTSVNFVESIRNPSTGYTLKFKYTFDNEGYPTEVEVSENDAVIVISSILYNK